MLLCIIGHGMNSLSCLHGTVTTSLHTADDSPIADTYDEKLCACMAQPQLPLTSPMAYWLQASMMKDGTRQMGMHHLGRHHLGPILLPRVLGDHSRQVSLKRKTAAWWTVHAE